MVTLHGYIESKSQQWQRVLGGVGRAAGWHRRTERWQNHPCAVGAWLVQELLLLVLC